MQTEKKSKETKCEVYTAHSCIVPALVISQKNIFHLIKIEKKDITLEIGYL